MVERICGTNEF